MKLTDKSVMLLALLTLNLCFAMVIWNILSISKIGMLISLSFVILNLWSIYVNIRTIIRCVLNHEQ
jgi:hypothetical protein